jgi:HNH endonuclease
MFDPGITHLVDGPNIDNPLNALTLTHDYHRLFGEFELYFEPTPVAHQYKIDSTETMPFLRDPLFPIIRTLYLSPERTIDPPSRRLLAIHRAIARILKLSAAGEYIAAVLRDVNEPNVMADGSTDLAHFLRLRLGGWSQAQPVF